jgi:uncharacterized membrane protein
MRNLSTTIAVYADRQSAESDWTSLESAAESGSIDLADAALVVRSADGDIERLERQSHHGWGKGAVAGAVVGLLFPPSLLGGAVAGGVGGGVIARLNRSLDRGDIKDLGEVMDSGEIALVAVTSEETAPALPGVLVSATSTVTRSSAPADEVRKALDAATAASGSASAT